MRFHVSSLLIFSGHIRSSWIAIPSESAFQNRPCNTSYRLKT
jgi:hypothetical protein